MVPVHFQIDPQHYDLSKTFRRLLDRHVHVFFDVLPLDLLGDLSLHFRVHGVGVQNLYFFSFRLRHGVP